MPLLMDLSHSSRLLLVNRSMLGILPTKILDQYMEYSYQDMLLLKYPQNIGIMLVNTLKSRLSKCQKVFPALPICPKPPPKVWLSYSPN
jgi:hypothetical protein